MADYHHHYFGVSKWNMYCRFTSSQCWACVALSINNILHIVLVIYRCLQVARHCTAIMSQCIDQERMSWVVYNIQGYSTIMFPFMPGPILILVSMTSVMIIVLQGWLWQSENGQAINRQWFQWWWLSKV